MQKPWWQDFFTGLVLELPPIYAEAQTQAEADFLGQTLPPTPGARILDVPCGEGRISLALAARGYQVTGVDLTPEYVARAVNAACERNLAVSFEQCDMRELPWHATFDHAYCFGNSFGYFPHDGNLAFLRAVHQTLKPGGTFVLQTNFCMESMLTQSLGRRWYPFGNLVFLHHPQYYPATGQLISDYVLINNGQIERKQATYQTYSYRELWRMFEEVGFTKLAGYGSLKREPFQLGSLDLLLVATRA